MDTMIVTESHENPRIDNLKSGELPSVALITPSLKVTDTSVAKAIVHNSNNM